MKSVFRLLFHTTPYYLFQPWRYSHPRVAHLRRLFLQYRVHHLDGRITAKGALPGKHFVQDRAERKYVRAMIRFLSTRLLRRHVTDSTHNHARICDPFLRGGVFVYAAKLPLAEFSKT